MIRALKCGAKSPINYRGNSEEIRKIIADHSTFNDLSHALTTAVTEKLPRLSMDGVKELFTLEGEIRAALFKVYGFDTKNMLEDFSIDDSNPVKSCLPFSQKYRITPNQKIMGMGKKIADLITCEPHEYSIYLPFTYNDVFTNEGDRESILKMFESREKIQNFLPTPPTIITPTQTNASYQLIGTNLSRIA